MPKLTDTQLVILSAAARRDDGTALPLPKSLRIKGAAVARTLDALRKRGLLEEKPASRDDAAWREGKDGRRMMLVITETGRTAIGDDAEAEPAARPDATKRARRSRATRKTAASKPKGAKAGPAGVRQGTKLAVLIDLLTRKPGATVDEMVAATGWQAHSVRGAISGALKRKLGFEVTSEKVDGRGRVYRIAGRG